MTVGQFEYFRKLVNHDQELRAQLQGEADIHAFVDLCVQTGRRLGFEFSADEVIGALQAAQRNWIERGLQ